MSWYIEVKYSVKKIIKNCCYTDSPTTTNLSLRFEPLDVEL